MENEKRGLVIIIVSISLAVLLALGLIGVYYFEKEKNSQRFDEWAAYEAETADIQAQIRDLKDEIGELNKPIAYFGDTANLIIGFTANDVQDITQIREFCLPYSITPVIIIDVDSELEDIESIVKAADKNWEIMLQIPDMSENSMSRTASVRRALEASNRSDCRIVFYRKGAVYNDSINTDVLKSAGFYGFIVYEESPTSGQTEDGLVYLNYYYTANDHNVIDVRLSQCYSNKASMVFAFDMLSLRQGLLSADKISDMLNKLSDCAAQENASLSTVGDAVSDMTEVNAKIAEIEAERDKVIALKQAEIDRLKQIVKSMEPKS